MEPKPNPMYGIIVAGVVTLGVIATTVALAVTGMFEKLGLIGSIGITVADLGVVGLFWFLAMTGRLKRPKDPADE